MIPAGGFALIEHPADAGTVFASIFKLPMTQRLLALPTVRKETFPQGLLGQVSPKPTSTLTLRMPGFAKLYVALKTDRMPPALPQRDADGSFATAKAKTYQPRFCALIAAMILDTCHRQHLDELRHAYFMREVIARFQSMLTQFEGSHPDDAADLVPHGISPSDINAEVAPLLDWASEEQVHGPDYHGPLPSHT